jgi:CheY-like chemotaxis protein
MRIALRPQRDNLPVTGRGVGGSLPPGLFVAVIDDDADIRRSTRQMLEVLGVEVFVAESARQAVQQLGRLGRVPDLLLSDYRLGAENGIQAIAMLREEFNHDIPALLITGDTSPERLEAFRATGLRVLYKPISGAQMLAAVKGELKRLNPSAP